MAQTHDSRPLRFSPSFSYTYDNLNNRTSVVELDGSKVLWAYDPTYQLLSEFRSGLGAFCWTELTLAQWSGMTLDQWSAMTLDCDCEALCWTDLTLTDWSNLTLAQWSAMTLACASGTLGWSDLSLIGWTDMTLDQWSTMTLVSSGGLGVNYGTDYSYDPAGNRLMSNDVTGGLTTYSYDRHRQSN